MDAFENENFFESIFKKWNQQFWYKRISCDHVKKIFGYRPDAWHLSKSAMIMCFALAAIYFDLPVEKWQDVMLYLIIAASIWNTTFWLFYHRIFRIK